VAKAAVAASFSPYESSTNQKTGEKSVFAVRTGIQVRSELAFNDAGDPSWIRKFSYLSTSALPPL